MRDLIVIPKAAALSLDSAAAFLRTSYPDADWLIIDAGDGCDGEGDGSGCGDVASDPGPPTDPSGPVGLSWLFGDGPGARAVPPDRVSAAIGSLEADGIIYLCRCSKERLRQLAETALASGVEPRYDGRCRSHPSSSATPASSGSPVPSRTCWRLRNGDPRDCDRPVDRILEAATLLGAGGLSRLVVPWDIEADGRRAIRLAEALGAPAVSLEVGPVVVGPDGSPLWRSKGTSQVMELARAGYEPGAVWRFLGGAAPGPTVFFSLEGLAAANRACILEAPEPIRLQRLAAELEGAGIPCPAEAEGLRRYWDAVVGRLYRYRDAGRHLAFLGRGWTAVATPERDRAQLVRVGNAVLEMRPGDGLALRVVLEALSRREDEIHDLRRVLRWAITGQDVAPSLTIVWDLLGAERALDRLANALEQIR